MVYSIFPFRSPTHEQSGRDDGREPGCYGIPSETCFSYSPSTSSRIFYAFRESFGLHRNMFHECRIKKENSLEPINHIICIYFILHDIQYNGAFVSSTPHLGFVMLITFLLTSPTPVAASSACFWQVIQQIFFRCSQPISMLAIQIKTCVDFGPSTSPSSLVSI